MLQIRKKMEIQNCKFNLSFLFRKKQFDKHYRARKQLTSTILLRSPKHFNIGKQKVINLNYQTPSLIIPLQASVHLYTFLHHPETLYTTLIRKIKTNPSLGVKSLRLRVATKITLMWLGILFLLSLLML